MELFYCEYDQHIITEENGKFGVLDKKGNVLMPFRYDNIYVANSSRESIGFVFCQNSKYGYVAFSKSKNPEINENGIEWKNANGCATAFLPSVYDRIEATQNGLVLCQNTREGEIRAWYDHISRKLHRDLYWVRNFGCFDNFLISGAASSMPTLKKAGEDEWVKFPKSSYAEPWQELPIDTVGVRCILCMEEIPTAYVEYGDGEKITDDCVVDGYEYFFLLLYKDGWMPTPSKRSLAELYSDLPTVMEEIKIRKNAKDGSEKKQPPSPLYKYEKQNED